MSRFPWGGLALVLSVAAVGRALLLVSGSVSFHSDEAIVALMARHMLQGDWPTFFYGQHYMGSLNVLGVAVGFWLVGESVGVIRVVQFGVFLLVVGTSYWAAWHLSHNRLITWVGGMALAVSAPVIVIYTATNIGSYAETLVFGNLLLILGYDVLHTHPGSRWRWLLLGFIGGLGWWAHGLIIVYLLPLASLVIWQHRGRFPYQGAALGTVAFLLGGWPWWWYNLQHEWAALAVYLPGDGAFESTLFERLVGLVALGLPTVFGVRYTWLEYYLVPVGLVVVAVYVTAIYITARVAVFRPGAVALVFGVPVALFGVFLASSFGTDPTGRYLIPLVLPLALMLGNFVTRLRARTAGAWWALPLVLVFGYNLSAQATAALKNDPGFTTQFNLETHAPNRYDDALIAFLLENNLQHGYTNYWIAYRLAFLSGEQVQYASSLSYREAELAAGIVERYPPYALATAQAERVAYISWDNLPGQLAALEAAFAAAGLDYRTQVIGPFWVFYDFSVRPARPSEIAGSVKQPETRTTIKTSNGWGLALKLPRGVYTSRLNR